VSEIYIVNTAGPIEGGVALINSNTLYAPASSDKVYRFDDTGAIEYTLNVNGDIKSSTTITPDHNVYIASTDLNLYSFNANGVSNPSWPIALGAEATASVAMDAESNVYIGTQNGIFQAVSPAGAVIWSYNVGGAVYASAAISLSNTLYIVNENGHLYAFNLGTLNPTNVQYKWRLETGGNVITSPALDDSSHIYITTMDGRLLKIKDEDTSGAVEWEFDVGSPVESSPVIDLEYNIYLGCNDGQVYAISDIGELIWAQATDGGVSSTAALAGSGSETDRLYIGSNDGYLYALSLSDGAIIWRYNAQSEIVCPILYQDTRIYLGTMDGRIIAILDPDLGQSLNKATTKATTNQHIWPTFQGDNARTGYQGSSALGINHDWTSSPITFALHQNYPNPFNPVSTIRYDLPQASNVTLIVYDILGREVARLVDGYMEPGYHHTMWDSRDQYGREVPSGIYIVRLVTPAYIQAIKMLLLK